MVRRVYLELNDPLYRALSDLADRLDFESMARLSRSDQETYDMVLSLEHLRRALKEAPEATSFSGPRT